jgi:hypothetical protein
MSTNQAFESPRAAFDATMPEAAGPMADAGDGTFTPGPPDPRAHADISLLTPAQIADQNTARPWARDKAASQQQGAA